MAHARCGRASSWIWAPAVPVKCFNARSSLALSFLGSVWVLDVTSGTQHGAVPSYGGKIKRRDHAKSVQRSPLEHSSTSLALQTTRTIASKRHSWQFPPKKSLVSRPMTLLKSQKKTTKMLSETQRHIWTFFSRKPTCMWITLPVEGVLLLSGHILRTWSPVQLSDMWVVWGWRRRLLARRQQSVIPGFGLQRTSASTTHHLINLSASCKMSRLRSPRDLFSALHDGNRK